MMAAAYADRLERWFPSLATAWRWWTGELSALFDGKTEASKNKIQSVVELSTDGALTAVLPSGRAQRASRRVPLAEDGVASLGLSLNEAEWVLRLPAKVLRRRRTLPLSAEGHLDAIIANQAERLSPWRSDLVYLDHAVVARDRAAKTMDVDVLVLPKQAVQEPLTRLDHSGIHATFVEAVDGDRIDRLRLVPRVPTPPNRWWWRSVLALLVINFAMGFAFAAWHVVERWQKLESLKTELAAIKEAGREIVDLRQRMAALATTSEVLLQAATERPPALAVLDEITEIIPDNAFLDQFRLDGAELQIAGYGSDAIALLGRLENGVLIADAAFAAPVRRIEGLPLDRFQITGRIVPFGVAE